MQFCVTHYFIRFIFQAVVRVSLVDGVDAQFHAFRRGVEAVFDTSVLAIFPVEEMEQVLCGHPYKAWSITGTSSHFVLCPK